MPSGQRNRPTTRHHVTALVPIRLPMAICHDDAARRTAVAARLEAAIDSAPGCVPRALGHRDDVRATGLRLTAVAVAVSIVGLLHIDGTSSSGVGKLVRSARSVRSRTIFLRRSTSVHSCLSAETPSVKKSGDVQEARLSRPISTKLRLHPGQHARDFCPYRYSRPAHASAECARGKIRRARLSSSMRRPALLMRTR